MVLDSQKQKETLLEVIKVAPVRGGFAEVQPMIMILAELAQAIQKAEIKKEGEEKNG